ncbi:LolA family protein [Curvivirga sp.]|uniref:LolA family protein n=1 Tax=Curvivirga sp. TaxID=2856848 RepID=UPI003B5B075C
MLFQSTEYLKSKSFTRRHFLRLLSATALITATGLPNFANAALTTPDLNDPEVIRSLEMAEEFFSLLTTMEARFIQANPDGSYLEGDMYMHRPGRMRFEYDDPVPILLVADGTFFIHVDKQLKQVMHIPLGSTPANFMLSEDLSIKDGLNLIGYERVNGILRMQFEQTDEPELGSMILTFTDDPMMLKQWTIIDAQQNRTTVTIIAPRFGDELDPDLFYFVNPWNKRRDN